MILVAQKGSFPFLTFYLERDHAKTEEEGFLSIISYPNIIAYQSHAMRSGQYQQEKNYLQLLNTKEPTGRRASSGEETAGTAWLAEQGKGRRDVEGRPQEESHQRAQR